MGQRSSRDLMGDHGPMSPVFAVDKVRGARGGMTLTSRYHVGRSLQHDYTVERTVLGTGASGHVRLAKRGTRQFAVKSFRKRAMKNEEKIELRREVEVYLKLDHPHVARLEDVYETGKELHLVMELMAGGELYDRLANRRHYSEADAASTSRQMLLAVAYLHAHNMVHRDLKLENFLYERKSSDHLKLIDFGFAKYLENGLGTKMQRSCGSLHYIAPEVLAHNYDEKADMWSLGVIVYMLLTGNPPFYGSTDEKCLYRIQKGEPCFSSQWKKVSGQAQQFVLSLLDINPENRPSAADALKQPWICQTVAPQATLDIEVLASLKSFSHASHFRRACLSMMAWSLTLEDQMELRTQFEALDLNKSGTITRQEFNDTLQANFSMDSAEAETLFRGLDGHGHDEICYSEFMAGAMQGRMRMHEDVLHATFARFDVDGSGQITASNLRALMGDSFEDTDVEELIKEADRNGDGRCSYEEFVTFLFEGGEADTPPSMSNASSRVQSEGDFNATQENVRTPRLQREKGSDCEPSTYRRCSKERCERVKVDLIGRVDKTLLEQDPILEGATDEPLWSPAIGGQRSPESRRRLAAGGPQPSPKIGGRNNADMKLKLSAGGPQPSPTIGFSGRKQAQNTDVITFSSCNAGAPLSEEDDALLQGRGSGSGRRRFRWRQCFKRTPVAA